MNYDRITHTYQLTGGDLWLYTETLLTLIKLLVII